MKHIAFKLSLPCGVQISDSLRESDVISIRGMKKSDMGTGYVWYGLSEGRVGSESVHFSLCFFNGLIESINISLLNPSKYGAGWDDYSEEKEKICAKDTGEWLSRLGFLPGEYSWGSVWVGFESKSPFSGAVIRYKKKTEPVN